jgi:hypothetical protein
LIPRFLRDWTPQFLPSHGRGTIAIFEVKAVTYDQKHFY